MSIVLRVLCVHCFVCPLFCVSIVLCVLELVCNCRSTSIVSFLHVLHEYPIIIRSSAVDSDCYIQLQNHSIDLTGDLN
ncbi:hypothetical protein XELAEV_18010420mg [Xenopus laevis]|uniref:Uncharacterized protein n=1 Tax=Xenopus laevis TaxID=8355 RepID=A0A974DVC1_XENLA|nr:hypothetical protein XELAEV_18010420mg [Xenopus laevis]